MNLNADKLDELSPLQRATYALKEMKARLEHAEQARNEPIAIIGMGCRFPGGADSPERFWQLLRDGIDAVRPTPPERWDSNVYYDANPDAEWKMYTRSGGFLNEDIAAFDPHFFGISPREAASLDPQQRLALEDAWEALENAALPPDALAGTATGMYMGLLTADYGRIPLRSVATQDLPYMGTGNAISFPAGRVSYALGLQGPCMVVATECSSTLVAVHLAAQALRAGECDLALAGGVTLIVSPEINIILSRMRALAPDGRSKSFDASAANQYDCYLQLNQKEK